MSPRVATFADAAEVALLLHDFNVEFDTETPGPDVLARRLERLLPQRDVVALLGDATDTAVAVVSLRSNVWCDGPVALLDELYVRPELRSQGLGSQLLAAVVGLAQERGVRWIEINVDEPDADAQRFYERHGFARSALFYEREL